MTVMLVTALPMPLLGSELKLVPGLALKDEFNDNIFLVTNSRRTDFITTLTPSLDISRTTETSNFGFSTGVNWLNYIRNAGLDSADLFIRSGFNYQYDPRLSVSLGAGYVQDSRPDQINQNGVATKSGSDLQNYQLSGSFAVSEKSTSSVSYAYSQESFDNQQRSAPSQQLKTTTAHTVTIAQDYDLDRYLRQAKLVGNFGYFRSLTDTSQVDNYTVSLGITKKIHELWYFSLNAGGRLTHSESHFNTVISPTTRADNQGWIGNLSITYSGEKTNGSLSFKNDVIPASGTNGITQRTELSTNLSHKFNRELSGSLGQGFSWIKSDQKQLSTRSIVERNLVLNGGLRYDFSDYVSLEGNYRFITYDYGTTAGPANQNIFMLRLTMRRDLMNL